ncbi:MAG: GAF domain-containing sensor histidine kinase [Elusimicrobiota bacterium]
MNPARSGRPLSAHARHAVERIALHVNDALSIEEAVDCVWNATNGLVPRDRIGLSFIDSDGARVTARYARTEYPDLHLAAGYSVPLAGSSLQALLRCGKVRIIPDLNRYLRVHQDSESTKLMLREGVRGSITLPLRVRDRHMGFMFFSTRLRAEYREEHALLLRDMLDRISQAVEKTWIIKQLEDARKNYLKTLGFVAHEIKSPLASITAKAMTYMDGYLGKVEPQAGATLRAIIRNTEYLLSMVNDYMELSRLESGEVLFEPVKNLQIVDVLRVALDMVAGHAAVRGTRLRVGGPVQRAVLDGDPDSLTTVVINLLDNAVKYGVDKQTVRVLVSVDQGWLTLKVRNQGVGFAKEESARLFRRFSRLHQKGLEDRKGSGLGLYLAWLIAQRHKGSLTAASEPGKWAEFTLRLPNARLLPSARRRQSAFPDSPETFHPTRGWYRQIPAARPPLS